MGVLNVRNVPDELMRSIKATAAASRQSMREYVIEVLRRSVPRAVEGAVGEAVGIVAEPGGLYVAWADRPSPGTDGSAVRRGRPRGGQ